jgi:hypothetical protein
MSMTRQRSIRVVDGSYRERQRAATLEDAEIARKLSLGKWRVKVIDLNLLLYAVNRDSPRHVDAKSWLESTLSGEETVASVIDLRAGDEHWHTLKQLLAEAGTGARTHSARAGRRCTRGS